MRYTPAPAYPAPPAGRCRTRTDVVYDEVARRFAGQPLGCYGDRPITGGVAPSLHRDGRAFDIGFLHDTTDRTRQDAYRWLVANAGRLGLQQVLNYKRGTSGGTQWRLPRYSGETSPVTGSFSKVGHWLHVEVAAEVADSTATIEELLGEAPAPGPGPTPPPNPVPPIPPGGSTVNVTVPTIRRGSTGGWVRKAQAILVANFGQDLGNLDGQFGPRTDEAVRNVQRFFGLTVDGIVGPQTWGILLGVAP